MARLRRANLLDAGICQRIAGKNDGYTLHPRYNAVTDMTYNVFGWTLSLTQSINL